MLKCTCTYGLRRLPLAAHHLDGDLAMSRPRGVVALVAVDDEDEVGYGCGSLL